MSNTVTKLKFSASTDGRPVLVTATATPGTLVHTAVASLTVGKYDEIWLWLANNNTADVQVTVEYGDAATSCNIIYTVTAKDGLKCVLPGLVLQNNNTLRIFAATGSVISAFGFVNQVEPA